MDFYIYFCTSYNNSCSLISLLEIKNLFLRQIFPIVGSIRNWPLLEPFDVPSAGSSDDLCGILDGQTYVLSNELEITVHGTFAALQNVFGI